MIRWDKPRPTIFAALLPHIFHNLIILFIILQLVGRHNLPFPTPPQDSFIRFQTFQSSSYVQSPALFELSIPDGSPVETNLVDPF
jgi:hypothetical protein